VKNFFFPNFFEKILKTYEAANKIIGCVIAIIFDLLNLPIRILTLPFSFRIDEKN